MKKGAACATPLLARPGWMSAGVDRQQSAVTARLHAVDHETIAGLDVGLVVERAELAEVEAEDAVVAVALEVGVAAKLAGPIERDVRVAE